MSDFLTSPEHLADAARVKQAVLDARAAFYKDNSQENRDKVIEANNKYHEVCCCDVADYELFPHYITMCEDARVRKEIDQQYEYVLINSTACFMDDFENPELCSYYVPADQVQKLLDLLKTQIETKPDPDQDSDSSYEELLQSYSLVPERVRLIGVVNVVMYYGSYTKAKWESVMFGPPMEMKEYSFCSQEVVFATEVEEDV